MGTQVEIPDDLLKIVNTNTWFSGGEPDPWFSNVVLVGLLSLFFLAGLILNRVFHAEDLSEEFKAMGRELSQVLRSTLLTRLCLLCAVVVIPLVFYVNTKEHYWTAKHTVMLFTSLLGLCSWLCVCQRVPRFKTPFLWPVAVILITGSLSTFRAVNIAEAIGLLFAIFGSAIFFFLASQVISTSKRIHLFVLTLCLVAVVMSMYGLCQAYLLLPLDYIFAQETRAPVSTIGNKNYASYYIDLAAPLALALAVCRRGPKQTLLALTIFFICRWHFTLCDTRGGTIAMTIGILVTVLVVGYFHGRRFRLLLYAILLEPLLWAAMSAAKITYSDAQSWGSQLLRKEYRGQIADALKTNLPKDFQPVASYLQQAFMSANEYALGLNVRLWALVIGFVLALSLFYLLIRFRTEWTYHLGGAALLAFLPYWFAMGSMPSPSDHGLLESRVMNFARDSGALDYGFGKEMVVQLLNQYKHVLVESAQPYNELLLSTQQNVAAMMSLTLFIVMAVFLIFRWYDRPEGWLPGFAVCATIGAWFLMFLLLCDGDSVLSRLGPLDSAWTKTLSLLHREHPWIGMLFTTFSFALYSILALLTAIFITQWIPAHLSASEAERLGAKAKRAAMIGFPASLLVIFVLMLLFNTRFVESRKEAVRAMKSEGITAGLFEGAHRFFNTKDQDPRMPRDGAIGFRLETYQASLRKLKDSWNTLLGIGPGNFKVVHPHPRFETALERRILGREVLGRRAHNDFLDDAAEGGAFAFLGLLWMFTTTGYLLYLTLKRIHIPKSSTDVFVNTITWGITCSMVAIFVHAQFEMALLQPSSTYPCWMLFGVTFQLSRIQKLRTQRALSGVDLLDTASTPIGGSPPIPGSGIRSASSYELPGSRPHAGILARISRPAIVWPTCLILVTLMTGGILVRQFVGEVWLRWGMILSEGGVERYADVFKCMEKSMQVYPQEMETNYILGRYCIDAVQLALPTWTKLNGPQKDNPKVREEAEQEANEVLKKRYQLDVDKLIDYAQLGVDVYRRDIFMNPNYKWAHNNMGVLCDKLSSIYEILASAEDDLEKRKEYQTLAKDYEDESRNCYYKALEIDDLQVYALFNLGIGAYRDGDLEHALKYFERTLLADPGKGDVNLFIARCRLANNDLEGGVEACRQMFAWEDRHPRNLNRKEGAAEVRLISESDRAELEQLLVQVARLELSTKELDTAKLAAETLVEEVDRCKHLPLLARILADSGEAKQAIQFGEEANNGCGRTALSAESFFAQAKAHCLLGEATPAARILTALLSDKKVAGVFVDLIRSDAAFDILKGTDAYQAFLAADSPSGTSIEKSNPPVPPDPLTTPIQDGENSESQDGIPRPPG